jgi:hypothetical protein
MGPVQGLTEREAREARRRFTAFFKRYTHWLEKTTWLDENPHEPDWDELAEKVCESARKVGVQGDELAAWLGVEVEVLMILFRQHEAMRDTAWA